MAAGAPSSQLPLSPLLCWSAAGDIVCARHRWARLARLRWGSVGISGKLAELWEAATGGPPGAVLSAAAVVYKVASGLLAPPPPPRRLEEPDEAVPPAPEPVEVGEITEEELRRYDPEKPLLMAIKGQIYDVSRSRLLKSALHYSLQPGLKLKRVNNQCLHEEQVAAYRSCT